MKVLLLSSYELGRQPVHIASPAAALGHAGHEHRAVDLSLDTLHDETLTWAEAVAFSVPMHTAKRMADTLSAEIKTHHPDMPVAHYGLYAGVGDAEERLDVDATFEGEYEPALVEWVDALATDDRVVSSRHVGRSEFFTPDRTALPTLDRYARLEHNGVSVLAGAVEASHGCRHRCRHCPITAVYDGRIRVVPQDVVLSDINQLVAAGAQHITFGDADFLNAPPHSISLLERAHDSHPDVTFDATIKVEHILQHADLWHHLAEQNLLFVISAFESVDEDTLSILEKGHTVDDMIRAIGIVRDAAIHIRPTWLPFAPWTQPEHISALHTFITDNDLSTATDPVQMAIKLLIPQGSLLENHPAVTPHLTHYDPTGLTWQWTFAKPDVEALYKELSALAADASECGQEVIPTLEAMWMATANAFGSDLGPLPRNGTEVPRLTESWFCCAEPTGSHTISLQIGSSLISSN